ncbi:Orn/Lys/Arg family decarboxylase, partial [Clostridium tertium]|uniref:Orn/Lys/Arg family decarboxylase n=2 Tax=Clostridium TaxID=1485 RepID=UPI0024B3A932
GLILRKLKVIYIDAVIDEEIGIFLPPSEKEINEALNKASNPKGIIITSPNYFGVSYDIENKINELKEKGIKVIIDSAHGAHFGISKELPKSLAKLGDYVVLSAHKTLPSLTQGAYLLVNDNEEKNIDFYIKAFMTTSPSYLIMASLDYARYYLDNYGEYDYGNLIERAEKWKEKINSLNKVKIIDDRDLADNYIIDRSRYLIILNKGYSGHKLLNYLRDNKIQAEMSFSQGVVLILSPSNIEEDFGKLYLSIANLDISLLKTDEKNTIFPHISPVKVLEPYEIFSLNSVDINIEDSLERIAKEAIIPYPPGIPLICAGEKITKEAIDIIKEYIDNRLKVIGVHYNTIKVIEK